MGAAHLGELFVLSAIPKWLAAASIRYNADMVEWSFDTSDAQAAHDTRLEFVQRVHRRFGDALDVAVAELVLGELIGNVVRYAPGPTHIQANFDDRGVTIVVKDWGTGFTPPPMTRPMGLFSESGRGLAIVAQLAENVEIDCESTDGCCVRARLDVRSS